MQAPTRTYLTTLTLQLQAASQALAHGIGEGAAEHLIRTFNDDGSIEAVTAHGMEPGSITLSFTLADQQCYDIMCTATEGGINYWADIIKRKGQLRDDSEIPDIVSFEADVQDGPVSCDHPEIEAQEIGRFTIGPDMIRAGLRRLLAPGAEISPAIRNDAVLQLVDPEHASDADTADAIVQFAVFGELVFS